MDARNGTYGWMKAAGKRLPFACGFFLYAENPKITDSEGDRYVTVRSG
jgi:hypothetical protein